MQKGFTLIELMSVVAIIGILAAIAIPSYTGYIIKSRISSALYEVGSAKPAYEIIVTQNSPTNITHSDLNIQQDTTLCTITVNLPNYSTDAKVLSCNLKDKSALQANAEIYLERSPLGQYTCKTVGIPSYFIPKGCS